MFFLNLYPTSCNVNNSIFLYAILRRWSSGNPRCGCKWTFSHI